MHLKIDDVTNFLILKYFCIFRIFTSKSRGRFTELFYRLLLFFKFNFIVGVLDLLFYFTFSAIKISLTFSNFWKEGSLNQNSENNIILSIFLVNFN